MPVITAEMTRASLDLRQQRAAARRRVEQFQGQGRLAAGMRELADVLDERHWAVERTRLWDVLGWVPRIDDARRWRLLGACGVRSPYRLVEELTDRQIAALAAALRTPCPGGTP